MAATPLQPDMTFADPSLAQQYATFRPQPPEALVKRVVDFWRQGNGRSSSSSPGEVTEDTLIVDVGCGSGQSTHQFASHFSKVVGVDVSPDQLAEGRNLYKNLTNVSFMEGGAENLPLPFASADLVTVCAAVHWFDLPAFYAQVDRVLRPGGVLATYAYLNSFPVYNGRCLRGPMEEIWSGMEFWTPQHEHLKRQYITLPVPSGYKEDVHVSSDAGDFEVSTDTDLDTLMGYCLSWSSVGKYRKRYGEPALQLYMKQARQKLLTAMGTEEENPKLRRRYRYFLRMWRKPIMI